MGLEAGPIGYIFTEGSLSNVELDGGVIGYEMRTRIPYYRGIPLSMVHDVEVEVDGAAVPREDIRFTADGGAHWWTLAEMETVLDISNVPMCSANSIISFLSVAINGRKIGVVVTLLITFILNKVCDAICPSDSPVIIVYACSFFNK